jgi:hypothetical protein
MRRLFLVLFLFGSLAAVSAAEVATGHVVKVLPLLLDQKGRAALSPSLFDRDAYQAFLRQPTNQISAIRFDIEWSTSHADGADLKLRLELHGTATNNLPSRTMLEKAVKPHYFRHWTSLTLGGDDLKNFGDVTAWRATLWDGERMIAEQKSFLW